MRNTAFTLTLTTHDGEVLRTWNVDNVLLYDADVHEEDTRDLASERARW